ncbi:MAG: hypothetical protein Q8P10_02670, partial [bacterium]|nr:hypothetical protein [bacterium]
MKKTVPFYHKNSNGVYQLCLLHNYLIKYRKCLHKKQKFINFMPMQGKKNYQEKLFTSFKLSDRV